MTKFGKIELDDSKVDYTEQAKLYRVVTEEMIAGSKALPSLGEDYEKEYFDDVFPHLPIYISIADGNSISYGELLADTKRMNEGLLKKWRLAVNDFTDKKAYDRFHKIFGYENSFFNEIIDDLYGRLDRKKPKEEIVPQYYNVVFNGLINPDNLKVWSKTKENREGAEDLFMYLSYAVPRFFENISNIKTLAELIEQGGKALPVSNEYLGYMHLLIYSLSPMKRDNLSRDQNRELHSSLRAMDSSLSKSVNKILRYSTQNEEDKIIEIVDKVADHIIIHSWTQWPKICGVIFNKNKNRSKIIQLRNKEGALRNSLSLNSLLRTTE